jgi:hypothetical protein
LKCHDSSVQVSEGGEDNVVSMAILKCVQIIRSIDLPKNEGLSLGNNFWYFVNQHRYSWDFHYFQFWAKYFWFWGGEFRFWPRHCRFFWFEVDFFDLRSIFLIWGWFFRFEVDFFDLT